MKSLLIVCLFALFASQIFGATITWDSTVKNGDWTSGSSWQGGVAPQANDIAVLGDSSTTVQITSAVTIGNVTTSGATVLITANNGALTVSDTLTLSTGTVLRLETGRQITVGKYLEFAGNNLNLQLFGTSFTAPAVKVSTTVTAATFNPAKTGSLVINIQGGQIHLINNPLTVIDSVFTFANVAHTFTSKGGNNVVTFPNPATFQAITVDNNDPGTVSFNIQQGATFNGNWGVVNTALANTRPTVTMAGNINVLTANMVMDVNPIFSVNGAFTFININTNTIAFTDKSPSFTGVKTLGGNGGLSFTNTDNVNPKSITFDQDVVIAITTFTASGRWDYSGNKITYNNAVTYIATNTYTYNGQVVLLQGATINSGFTLNSNAGGNAFERFLIYTSLNILGGTFTFNFAPSFTCAGGAQTTFTLSGTMPTLPVSGLFVGPCTHNAPAPFSINAQVSLFGNATLNGNFGFGFNTNAFSVLSAAGSNPPASSSWGLTTQFAVNVPNGNVLTVNAIELINTQTLTVNTNGQLAGSGVISFASNQVGFTMGSDVVIGITIALPPGSFALTSTNPVQWNAAVLLRNTIVAGNAFVNYQSGLTVKLLGGVSTLTNPNWIFKGVLTTTLVPNGLNSQENATFIMNSGNNRILQGSVTPGLQTTIVFDENINLNSSISFTTQFSNPNGAYIVFRNNGGNFVFNTLLNNALTIQFFGPFLYFNNTVGTQFTGLSPYIVSGAATIYLSSPINVGTTAALNNLKLSGGITIGLVNSVAIGQTVSLEGGVTLNDLDNNPLTAVRTLSINDVTSVRTFKGQYVLGGNLVAPNIIVDTGAILISGPGSLTITGNDVNLRMASVNWRSNIIFSAPTTFRTDLGSNVILSISENTSPLNVPPNTHGFNINFPLTIGLFVELQFSFSPGPNNFAFGTNYFYVSSNQGAPISGSGTLSVGAAELVNTLSSTATISVAVIRQNANTIYSGNGPFNLVTSENLFFNGAIIGSTPVSFGGSLVKFTANSEIPASYSFTASPVTFDGTGSPTITFTGVRTISNAIIFKGIGSPVVFNDPVTITNTASFTNFDSTAPESPTLQFKKNLVTTGGAVTINQVVNFGNGVVDQTPLTVTGSGAPLTLTASSITVTSAIVSGGSNIISSRAANLSPQIITSGNPGTQGGSIPSQWLLNSVVELQSINVTGTRDVNLNHKITGTVSFVDGLTFTTGATFVAGTNTPTINVGNSIVTSVPTTIIPGIAFVGIGPAPFTFSGAATLSINGTYTCRAPTTFQTGVLFGTTSLNPYTAATMTFQAGCQWLGSTTNTLWRTSLVNSQPAAVQTNIMTNTIFAIPDATAVTVTAGGATTLNFAGTVTLSGQSYNFNGALFTNSTIVSQQNCTLNNISPVNTITFQSTTAPWVEPIVSWFSGTISNQVVLNGPIRIPGASFTAGSSVSASGAARLAVTGSLTISGLVTFSAPLQLYVLTSTDTFTVTASANTIANLSPSLFNPLGFTTPKFVFNAAAASSVIRIRDVTNAYGEVTVQGAGTTRFSTGTFSATTFTVTKSTAFWLDRSNLNVNFFILSAENDNSNPCTLLYTISATASVVTANTAVYRGQAIISIFNAASVPAQSTIVSATFSSGLDELKPVTGTPGYTYTVVRSGTNLVVNANQIPTVGPFPTQTNGPNPIGVSSSSSIVISFTILFAIIFFLVFFN